MEENNKSTLGNLNNKCYCIEELELQQNRNLLILSRSNSGKTVLIKNIIHFYLSNFNFNSVILYSKTCKYDKEYDFIQSENKFDGSLDALINDILNFQKESNNKMKILFIMDDLEISKKCDSLSNLFALSRHFNLTTILSCQYVKNIVSSTIRANAHYIFFNQLNLSNLECVYEMLYLDIDKKTFFKYIYNVKEQYSFIFYNNTQLGKNISDLYRLCKAKNELKFNVKM